MKEILKEIFYYALQAIEPQRVVLHQKDYIRQIKEERNFERLLIIAFGKAACQMAKPLIDLEAEGIAITKYGHCNLDLKGLKIFEAGHPIPDENSIKATLEVLKMAEGTDEKTLTICLISGGGSALLVAPDRGLTLHDKAITTDLLLKAGADILELNTVRKHLSRVKGGRLLQVLYPSRVISLIISDVLGDRLDMIASGPTAPDPTTYYDAWQVLKRYSLLKAIPVNVSRAIKEGIEGQRQDTPKPGDPIFSNVENIIIANNRKALLAAKEKASSMGFKSVIISESIQGEARVVATELAELAKEISKKEKRRVSLISGGETTVTVKGKGLGGRNTEFALAFAIAIKGHPNISLLSAGTDGTDGPTDAAGAIVDGNTLERAERMGLDPIRYLENNDSYSFFKKTGDLLITGPTGTNVMDVQIITIAEDAEA